MSSSKGQVAPSLCSIDLKKEEQSLPTNVSLKEQLGCLPDALLSKHPTQPLQYKDSNGIYHYYHLRPFFYSAVFILLVDLCERFCYNGIIFSQEAYLTGLYDPTWNANMTAVKASTFVSVSTSLTYLSPLLGGIMADMLLGDYLEILIGSTLFYIPGLVLVALVAYPDLIGSEYNYNALVAGTLVLWPIGAGAMKSVVNVFGAKQYHPILQSAHLENFYVYYYIILNIGALAGGMVVPLIAETSQATAFTIPACIFTLGLILFVIFRKRYVQMKPDRKVIIATIKSMGKLVICQASTNDRNPTSLTKASSQTSDGGALGNAKRLLYVIPISSLIIPFALVYFQLPTVFVIQGTAMKSAGWVDASLMNSLDAISVIIVGFLMSQYLYPFLSRNYGITIPTTIKFSIGTMFAAFSILLLLAVDQAMRSEFTRNGTSVSILWQTASYLFVGGAKVFCFSSAYEVTFQVAPTELKGMASSLMIVVSGAVPSILSVLLYNACETWFPTSTNLEDYMVSDFAAYLWMMFGFTSTASLALLLPPIRKWVERLKCDGAVSMDQTTLATSRPNEFDVIDYV